jgi:RNA polymerase sigma factor (TIGR02999 family)
MIKNITKSSITIKLQNWLMGDKQAGLELFHQTYEKLVSIAGKQRYKTVQITLTPAEVVHESYFRLNQAITNSKPQNSVEYFRLAAHVFKLTCIDYLRAKLAKKRNLSELTNEIKSQIEDDKSLLQILIILEKLEKEHEIQAIAFQLHYITGLTIEETAQMLKCSKATVSRHITFARHWLASKLR